jgi:hypothetical protein
MKRDETLTLIYAHDVFRAVEKYAKTDPEFRLGLMAARFGGTATFEEIKLALLRLCCRHPVA